MFKNCVFKVNVNTKAWLKSAGIRALKTMAQTAVSLITVGQIITKFNWLEILGISATSAVVSLLTSVAGIPEVKENGKEE